MKNKNIIIAGLIAIVLGGAAGFFGGVQYQKSSFGNAQDKQFFTANVAGGQRGFGNARFGQGQGQSGRNFMPIAGEITESDDKSITVKMPDGSSKIVILSDSTEINKSSTGTKLDLKAGEKVAVFGSANSDGSVTAQNIQLNPQMRMMQRPTGTEQK